MARLRPLGFGLWDCWGRALTLERGSRVDRVAGHVYEDIFDGVRLMGKFIEYDQHPGRWRQMTVEPARRARELGLKVQLSIDWHNIATGPNDYHKSRYFPQDERGTVAAMLDEIKPDQLEVCNEPYHLRGPGDMTTAQYAEHVYTFVRGAKDARFDGLIIATQTRGAGSTAAWEWHVQKNPGFEEALIVDYDGRLAESKHEPPSVLHHLTSPEEYAEALRPRPDPNDPEAHPYYWQRPGAKGWRFSVFINELSSVGTEVHINSETGARMVRETLKFFKEINSPFCFLHVGGLSPHFGAAPNEGGGWNMNTELINDEGVLSEGVKEMYRFLGKQLPDVGEPDEPDQPGGGSGIAAIKKAKKSLDKSVEIWGSTAGAAKARQARRRINRALDRYEETG